MKKNTLIVAVLLSISLLSCKKEETKALSPDNTNYSEFQGDEIISKIKAFEKEIENPTSESQISLENSIWLAEAEINFDYAIGNNVLNQSVYSEEIDWEKKSKTETNFTETITLYKSVKKVVEEYTSKNNKKVVLIDLSISKNNRINISIINGDDLSNSKIPSGCLPFGSTAYWDSYNGQCGPYSGQGTSSGAPQQLTQKLNAKCVEEICNNGGRIVYTNIVTTQIMGVNTVGDNTSLGMNILNPYDVTVSGDGITDYCLYFAYGNLAHTCLAPNEMNAYVSAIKYLANMNKPSGKDVVNYNIQFSACTCMGPNTLFHILNFTSGTKTCYIESN